jgi:hypothetical protein
VALGPFGGGRALPLSTVGPVRYLRTVELPVDELVDWPGNPRLHDDELIDASIELYGQTRSVREAEASPLGLAATGWREDELDDLRAQLEEAGRQVVAQAQPALPGANGENVPPSGIQGANSIEDKLAAYAAGSAQGGAVRSVILSYAGAQYVWMVEQLAALQHVHDVDSNAEVVRKLVEEAIGQAAPAAEGWTDAVPDAGEAASPDA